MSVAMASRFDAPSNDSSWACWALRPLRQHSAIAAVGDIGILTKKQPFAACGRQVIKKELDSCPN
jgi:hypothetical protein